MALGGWTPYHLKSAQGRCRHHLKWPFSFFLFMGLVGYLHPINPFIWPHLRLHFWHLIRFKRKEEKRRDERSVFSKTTRQSSIEERARLRARAHACAHARTPARTWFWSKGVRAGARRCAQARNGDVPTKSNLPFPGVN